jgi:hypothetical protein
LKERPCEEIIIDTIAFKMIHLPAIEFPGGPITSTGLPEERPEIIHIPGDYWLAETYTTYELWNAVYNWAVHNGYEFNSRGRMGTEEKSEEMNDQHPVTFVDWTSVAVWCNALTDLYNRQSGKNLVPVYEHMGNVLYKPVPRIDANSIIANPGADGFRLPSGFEWEMAARYSCEKKDGSYREYPERSGHYWAPFYLVNGEPEYKEAKGNKSGNVEFGSIVSKPVLELEVKDLGFTGFTGKDGKLWQWCYEFLLYRENTGDSFHLKRGGSRAPRCGRHEYWPRDKGEDNCNGYDQITFRIARNAGPASK